MPGTVFVHFLNDQTLKFYGVEPGDKRACPAANKALRLAVLISLNPPIIPQIDLVQSPLHNIDLLRSLARLQLVTFVGSDRSAGEMLERKNAQTEKTRLAKHYKKESEVFRTLPDEQFEVRIKSTSSEIQLAINKTINDKSSEEFHPIRQYTKHLHDTESLIKTEGIDVRNILDRCPTILHNRPYMWDIAMQQLGADIPKMTSKRMEVLFAASWLNSHLEEYEAFVFTHIPGIGKLDLGNLVTHKKPYRDIEASFKSLNAMNWVNQASPEDLVGIREDLTYARWLEMDREQDGFAPPNSGFFMPEVTDLKGFRSNILMALDAAQDNPETINPTGGGGLFVTSYCKKQLDSRGSEVIVNPKNREKMEDVKVFISHSSKDKEKARRISEKLKSEGIHCWLDEEAIGTGESISAEIEKGLKESQYFLILLSPNSINSRWVRSELSAALFEETSDQGILILPAVIEDCEIPILLKDRLFADLREDFEKGLRGLIATITKEGIHAIESEPQGKNLATDTDCMKKLAKLPRPELRRRICRRLDRAEIGVVWFDVFDSKMDDDLLGKPKIDCAIELLTRSKNRNKLTEVLGSLCAERNDIANP